MIHNILVAWVKPISWNFGDLDSTYSLASSSYSRATSTSSYYVVDTTSLRDTVVLV